MSTTAYKRAWRTVNRERLLAADRARYLARKAALPMLSLEERAERAQRMAVANKRWRDAHPEKLADLVARRRIQRQADPEPHNAKRRAKYVPTGRTVEERFWAKVDKSGQCWVWKHATPGFGYGRFWIQDDSIGAHRAAWLLTYGPIPDGLFVLHNCDNPPCVRPDHLRLGTQRDNVHDEFLRGRHRWQRRNAA